ncbi:MAG: hypothetical protein JNM20_17460 [Rhizobiales bacterium]|nr:hypothetical protein [Hyphomicrobiales bacterium]
MPHSNTAETQGPRLSGLAWLPVAWLVVSMALDAYRTWTIWPLLNNFDLPPTAIRLIEGQLAVAAITLIGGLFVLAAALGRMRIYPSAFTLWQGFVIATILAVAIYTAIVPDFLTPPMSYVYWLGEIAIGIACIVIVRKPPLAPHGLAQARSGDYSVLARIIFALLGVLLGGFIGFWIGLGIGIAIAEATNMSSFEGQSGFFAFFIGLAGVLVGAIIGPALTLYWTRRKTPAVTPP